MNRCALCPGRYNCVPPSGPTDTDIVFISGPTRPEEDKKGTVLVSMIGKEMDEHYLPVTGLRRDISYFTNSIKCLPDTSRHKLDISKQTHRDLLESCANTHLYNEIANIGPKLIVPMGAFACHAIDPDITLDLHHGIPIQTRLGIVAFPMWHPADVLHEPKKMLQIRTDFIRLRAYLKGKLPIRLDEYPEPDYQECNDYTEIDKIDPTIPMACDTEWSKSLGPYVMTYSQYPGQGRLIRADRHDLLEYFQSKIDYWESIILFHNWLYDKKVTLQMGLNFPDKKIRDTMIRVFHLGNLPQGLKALAYRELGMDMQDFDDLVKPYSAVHVLDYYRQAYNQDWPKPPIQNVIDDKTGQWKEYKPQSIKTKLKRFFTDLSKNQDKDVFQMWEKNWENEQYEVEQRCGPWPGKDIAHVPFELVKYYACRDADATIRLNPILEHMRRQVRRKPQDQWRVA